MFGPQLRPWSWQAFLFAFAMVAISGLIQGACLLAGSNLLFAAFLLAVFIVGVVAGAPAAGFALLLSIPVVWWAFVPPFFMFNPLTIADAHDIDLFFLFGALLIGIADLYRQSLNILTRTRLKTGDHSVAPNSR
jgi:hypothetical protein